MFRLISQTSKSHVCLSSFGSRALFARACVHECARAVAIVEVDRRAKEIDALNCYTIGVLNADGKGLYLYTKVQIIRILSTWSFVVKAVIRIVKPPFTIDIDEFTLTFKEVRMMFGFPTYAVSVVSKCSICR